MSNLFGTDMNTNMQPTPEEDQKQKMIKIAIGAVVAVVVIIIAILMFISYLNGLKNNITVDGSTSKLNNVLLIKDTNGTPYVCIEKIASLLKYEFYNGEFGASTEDKTQCYVKNVNEIVMFKMDSPEIYKVLTENTSMYDYYKMEQKVKRINDRLYISLPIMGKAFNVKYKYNAEKNTMIIDTLPGLVKKYNVTAKQKGYDSLAEEFINQKALINNMIVVLKEKQYGVLNMDYSVLIGTKYSSMQYSEGMNEFIVSANNKTGVLNKDASKKVDFNYDEIKLIDNNLGLYLARNSKKYGVLEKNGNELIPLDYDCIGIKNPSLFQNNNIKNPYVLYNNCIPVQEGEKWGMFDVKGTLITPKVFSGFGCIASTTAGQTSENVLLIPASEGIEGIVVSKKNSFNKNTYGILSTQGIVVVSDKFNKIYKTTSAGISEYFMLFGTTVYRAKDKITQNNTEVNGNGAGTVEIPGGGNTDISNSGGKVNASQTNTSNTNTSTGPVTIQ